jgi:hypothetical protein
MIYLFSGHEDMPRAGTRARYPFARPASCSEFTATPPNPKAPSVSSRPADESRKASDLVPAGGLLIWWLIPWSFQLGAHSLQTAPLERRLHQERTGNNVHTTSRGPRAAMCSGGRRSITIMPAAGFAVPDHCCFQHSTTTAWILMSSLHGRAVRQLGCPPHMGG